MANSEAALLAQVRTELSGVMDLRAEYLTAGEILDRYEELMTLACRKGQIAPSHPAPFALEMSPGFA